MEQPYLACGPDRLSIDTPIPDASGYTVGDFWEWAYSDVLSNRNRSIFAEFLVGAALGVTKERPRMEWNAYDLDYAGKRIEVKSAAFAQGWKQRQPSEIRFDIGPKRPWNAATNEYSPVPCRYSDLYVFCLMTATEDAYRSVLNAAAWEFYVAPTPLIDQLGPLKNLSLARLTSLRPAVSFANLRSRIDNALV